MDQDLYQYLTKFINTRNGMAARGASVYAMSDMISQQSEHVAVLLDIERLDMPHLEALSELVRAYYEQKKVALNSFRNDG